MNAHVKNLLLKLSVSVLLLLSGCHSAQDNSIQPATTTVQSTEVVDKVDKHDPYANATQLGVTPVKKSIMDLKDTTDLSRSSGGDNSQLRQANMKLAQSPITGLDSPELASINGGSNVSACIFNATNTTYLVGSASTLEEGAYGPKMSMAPRTYACLDEIKFPNGSRDLNIETEKEANVGYIHLDTNAADKTILIEYHPDTSNKGAPNMHALASKADSSDLYYYQLQDNSSHKDSHLEYHLHNSSIDSVVNILISTLPLWVSILIVAVLVVVAIVLTVITSGVAGSAVGMAAASAFASMGAGVGTFGIVAVLTAAGLSFGSYELDASNHTRTLENSSGTAPDYANDYNRITGHTGIEGFILGSACSACSTSSGDSSMVQIGYADEEQENTTYYMSLGDIKALEVANKTEYHKTFASWDSTTEKYTAYSTNVMQLCLANQGEGGKCPSAESYMLTYHERASGLAIDSPKGLVVGDGKHHFSQSQLLSYFEQIHQDELAFKKLAAEGVKGNWKSSNTHLNWSTMVITDTGNPDTGAIAEDFPYGRCQLGSEVNYVAAKSSGVKNNIMPIGAYRTLCKDITYVGGIISASCPTMVSDHGVLTGTSEFKLTVGMPGSCNQLQLVNGKFECAKDTGDLSDFPMQATAAGQCNVSEDDGRYTFTCANDKLQLKPLSPINKSNLINKADFSYYEENGRGKVSSTDTLIAAPKILACDKYQLNPESGVRPAEMILSVYGAKFKEDSFDPVYGDYSYTYQDKAGTAQTLALNVYDKCLPGMLITELGLVAGSSPTPQFELHCRVPKSGPELYSSVVAPKPGDQLYLQDPYSGMIVLKASYNLYTSDIVSLNYLADCEWGSGIALEDLIDSKTNNKYRVFTCKSPKTNINPTVGPDGDYKSSCTNIFYQNNSGYLQALCKKSDGKTLNASRVNTRYAKGVKIVNEDGVLKIK